MAVITRTLKLAALTIICVAFGPAIVLAWLTAFLTDDESNQTEAGCACCLSSTHGTNGTQMLISAGGKAFQTFCRGMGRSRQSGRPQPKTELLLPTHRREQ